MSDYILQTIKKLRGCSDDPEDTSFDIDIVVWVNVAINRLYQMGLTTAKGFVCDKKAKWEDLVEEESNLEMVKGYIDAYVHKKFDPPQSATLMQALNETINEMEWCITHELECGGDQND